MTFTAIKKSSHTWQKFSNDYDMIQLQNQQFTNNTLHERECSMELLVFSKGVLKNFENFFEEFLSSFFMLIKTLYTKNFPGN